MSKIRSYKQFGTDRNSIENYEKNQNFKRVKQKRKMKNKRTDRQRLYTEMELEEEKIK